MHWRCFAKGLPKFDHMNNPRVAPVTCVRHMGHCWNRWDSWHCWHTTCPHGINATAGRVSWQIGQVLLVPDGPVPVFSGALDSNFHLAKNSMILWSAGLSRGSVTKTCEKPSSPTLCFRLFVSSTRHHSGFGTDLQHKQHPLAALASHSAIKSLKICSLNCSWKPMAFLPKFCAKDMSNRDVREFACRYSTASTFKGSRAAGLLHVKLAERSAAWMFHVKKAWLFPSFYWLSAVSADPSLRGSAPRSLVCVCLVPDHTPAGVRVFRKRSFSTCCATFRHFFYLLFRMAWVRIWMLFECFGSASPRALEAGDSSFLVRSVGDVSAVFRAAVSHGLGTYSLGINPAAVPLFRKRFSKSFLFRMVWASILLAFLRVP